MVKVINQSFKIIDKLDGLKTLKKIEKIARICYKTEKLISEDGSSAKKLIKHLVDRGHTAMLEHGYSISVHMICNRGLTHELVRHRLASYAQESTRYCDYAKSKHGHEITVIKPLSFEDGITYEKYKYNIWEMAMLKAEHSYFELRDNGVLPQIARGVLPIDVKTEIVITANPTEWRHIFRLRTNEAAHPQIRTMMKNILKEFKKEIPILFDDL